MTKFQKVWVPECLPIQFIENNRTKGKYCYCEGEVVKESLPELIKTGGVKICQVMDEMTENKKMKGWIEVRWERLEKKRKVLVICYRGFCPDIKNPMQEYKCGCVTTSNSF